MVTSATSVRQSTKRSLETGGVPDGLVAVDLAGPEARYPDPLLQREAIELARSLGLHVTLHAGEWGGAAQVLRSLAVNPERIAHGPHAIEDPACVNKTYPGYFEDLRKVLAGR